MKEARQELSRCKAEKASSEEMMVKQKTELEQISTRLNVVSKELDKEKAVNKSVARHKQVMHSLRSLVYTYMYLVIFCILN